MAAARIRQARARKSGRLAQIRTTQRSERFARRPDAIHPNDIGTAIAQTGPYRGELMIFVLILTFIILRGARNGQTAE